MTLISGIHSNSFLAHICDHRPLLTTAGEELLRWVVLPRWDEQRGERVQSVAKIISVDNSNDAFKGAMLHAQDSHLRTKRIVTAYVPARTIRAGEGVTTWQVNDSEAFQIGTNALFTPYTESLPLGETAERLTDLRLRHFLCACLVEMLIEAGYCLQNEAFQGERDLYVGLGIPNEELDLRGIREATQQALRSLLRVTWTVRRTDEQGRVQPGCCVWLRSSPIRRVLPRSRPGTTPLAAPRLKPISSNTSPWISEEGSSMSVLLPSCINLQDAQSCVCRLHCSAMARSSWRVQPARRFGWAIPAFICRMLRLGTYW